MPAPSRAMLSFVLSAFTALDVAAQPLTLSKADYASASGARAIVVADFNRDGWPDIAQAGNDTHDVSILLNAHGEGLTRRSTIPVGTGPFALATDDFNRDGIPDLAVANADSNSISILIGRGDGRFTRADIGAHSSPRGIATGDINSDGKPDLVYAA